MLKNSRSSYLSISLLFLLMTTALLASCGGGGGGGGGGSGGGNPNPEPTPNRAPSITCPADTDITSGDAYFGQATATDPDAGDTKTFSLSSGNPPMSINPSTGAITGDTTGYGGQTINVGVKVVDSDGLSDTCNYQINVTNPIVTQDFDGSVTDAETRDCVVGGARAELTSSNGTDIYEQFTSGPNCLFQFNSIPEDTYTLRIDDGNGNLFKQFTTKIAVNQQKADEGKLSGLEFTIYKDENHQFVNDTLKRHYDNGTDSFINAIVKMDGRPVFDIYTTEVLDNVPVSQANIDGVVATIKNEVSDFYQENYTDEDINIIDSLPFSGQPADNHIKIYWNNNHAGGGNVSWFDNFTIKASMARFDTLVGKHFWIQELVESLIGGGESNTYQSVLNDPVTSDTLQPKDNMLSEILRTRPSGTDNSDTYNSVFNK